MTGFKAEIWISKVDLGLPPVFCVEQKVKFASHKTTETHYFPLFSAPIPRLRFAFNFTCVFGGRIWGVFGVLGLGLKKGQNECYELFCGLRGGFMFFESKNVVIA